METVSDLKKLLKNLQPKMAKTRYFMASVGESELMMLANYLDYITCIYREEEGLTVVLEEGIKEEIAGLTEKMAGPFALITLNVYSDLMAVGFLARISEALAKEKISINAFSAYHHDHLLVPWERRKDAMDALKRLQK
ncbi:ACT domain-containing protein [Candidatus Micrarchaeota archaeon]|nr:ACT domain-containing protein [Candidatus Micrarchaeota archaeon]